MRFRQNLPDYVSSIWLGANGEIGGQKVTKAKDGNVARDVRIAIPTAKSTECGHSENVRLVTMAAGGEDLTIQFGQIEFSREQFGAYTR